MELTEIPMFVWIGVSLVPCIFAAYVRSNIDLRLSYAHLGFWPMFVHCSGREYSLALGGGVGFFLRMVRTGLPNLNFSSRGP
jgi:hypothetical protein